MSTEQLDTTLALWWNACVQTRGGGKNGNYVGFVFPARACHYLLLVFAYTLCLHTYLIDSVLVLILSGADRSLGD